MNRYDVWVPQNIMEKKMMEKKNNGLHLHLQCCAQTIKRTHLLKRTIPGNEKWILYNNVGEKISCYE